MSTFIFDELTGTATVLATNRAKRADQTGAVGDKNAPNVLENTNKTDTKSVCYFCKGNEHLTPPSLYQDADDWNVRVFVNKFPIVEDHEVVVHSAFHDKDLPELSHDQNIRYIRALLNRVNYHTSRGKEVMIFNNRGGKAGASILHPHSQIIALEGFPGIVESERHAALTYYNEHRSCYWCDMLKAELISAERVVYESSRFVLLVPKASRWSYEMLLIPKTHHSNFEYIEELEINDFARILKAALRGYDLLFNNPDRNFWIHTQRYDPFHWHVGFIPHIKTIGGLELGAGIWVSDKASAEEAAQKLRVEVKKEYESKIDSIV